MSPHSRRDICLAASSRLAAAAPSLANLNCVVGLDGFVDEIISIVDKRHDRDHFDPVRTIDDFAAKISAAAGQSANYEMVVTQTKLGGNGPIMANALAAASVNVTCIGNLGYPDIHPVFADFAKRAALISIAPPSFTEALEFEDGKLMLGKIQPLLDIHWDNLLARIGLDRLTKLLTEATLIGLVNWTMIPFMSDIWLKLQDLFTTLPRTASNQPRTLFIDLADPEKRTVTDLQNALQILSKFQPHADVILGLNLKESSAVASALGISVPFEADAADAAIESTAIAIRKALKIGCVVIHPRRGAAAATADSSATFAGPFVQHPLISTGAGDHFNAGFSLARCLGFDLPQSLCIGVASSGYYVRTAKSASAAELVDFIANLPDPESS